MGAREAPAQRLGGLVRHHRDVPPEVVLAVGTGLCGAMTTYSTFSYETLRLFEDGARLFAFVNVVISLTGGLGAATVSGGTQ